MGKRISWNACPIIQEKSSDRLWWLIEPKGVDNNSYNDVNKKENSYIVFVSISGDLQHFLCSCISSTFMVSKYPMINIRMWITKLVHEG